jgi:uncharacterized protein (TIGR03086 family)
MDLDDLTAAQAAVSALLAGLAPDDWARASPCEEWDVAGVARHLAVGERAFTVSLGGTPYDLAAITAELADASADDLPTTYAAGAVALREALAGADPAGAFPTGLGPMPAPAIAELRTIEALTHGWDVARGAGRRLAVEDAVADRAVAHSLALMERLPPDRTPFGPPQPVPDDAPAIDRLAGLLGRRVD